MIDSFRVLECDVRHQLGEGLQQLDERQVVLPAQRLRLVTRQNAHDWTEVILEVKK